MNFEKLLKMINQQKNIISNYPEWVKKSMVFQGEDYERETKYDHIHIDINGNIIVDVTHPNFIEQFKKQLELAKHIKPGDILE